MSALHRPAAHRSMRSPTVGALHSLALYACPKSETDSLLVEKDVGKDKLQGEQLWSMLVRYQC